MIGRAPAFQFYAGDWLASTKIALMTPTQEGAYIRLLAHAWNDPDCSIPDDDNELAILSRLGEEWLKGGSQVVRRCFVNHPEKAGRLVNERLLEERQKSNNWRQKSSAAGIKSGKARRNHSKQKTSILKVGSQMVDKCFEPNTNQTRTLQSSSSSSSSDLFAKHLALICECCELSTRTMGAQSLHRLDNDLEEMRSCGMDLLLLPDFRRWWNENDWRGKKGQAPTIANVRSEWSKFEARTVAVTATRHFKCDRCQDTTSITVKADSGVRYVDCPDCQAVTI